MQLNIRTKNFSLTPALETLIEAKLAKPIKELLAKLDIKTNLLADIELEKTTRHHRKGKIWRAIANLPLPGKKSILRAESTAETIGLSLVDVKRKFFREIEKYKEKMIAKKIHKIRHPRKKIIADI